MKLGEYVDVSKLDTFDRAGYISRRQHPTLPLQILNYTASAQFDNFWPHEICACRGLIVGPEDEIVARPQYKFFNLGQTSTIIDYEGGMPAYVLSKETPQVIPVENIMVDVNYFTNLAQTCSTPTITRKMDGMMGVLWNYEEHWGIATRGSFESEGAKFATEKFQKFVKYGATEFIPKGWTLIFEIIAKHLRIVIPYEWEGLCLLTAINNETGEEMSYEQLHELWTNLNSYSKTLDANGHPVPGKPWCRLVERFNIDLETAQADPSMEEEGYVAAINRVGLPPIKVKIKLSEYKRLHKLLTGLTPQMVWEELANPLSQWLTSDCKYDRKTGETTHSMVVPAEFAQWLKQWQRGMTNAFHEHLTKAVVAQSELREWERGSGLIAGFHHAVIDSSPKFKNDLERKQWLRSPGGGGYSKDISDAALLLYNNRVVEAYEALWKLVRPHGRDDRFYVEGKGE